MKKILPYTISFIIVSASIEALGQGFTRQTYHDQEKQNLKGMLKQEFGLFKNQPSVQAEKPKKHEEMQIDWSNQ